MAYMISSAELEALGVEFVEPSSDGRRPGYYRRIPKTRSEPTLAQAQHRLKFSRVSHSLYGTRGSVETLDRREVPINASRIGEELKGSGQPKEVFTPEQKLLKLILQG